MITHTEANTFAGFAIDNNAIIYLRKEAIKDAIKKEYEDELKHLMAATHLTKEELIEFDYETRILTIIVRIIIEDRLPWWFWKEMILEEDMSSPLEKALDVIDRHLSEGNPIEENADIIVTFAKA